MKTEKLKQHISEYLWVHIASILFIAGVFFKQEGFFILWYIIAVVVGFKNMPFVIFGGNGVGMVLTFMAACFLGVFVLAWRAIKAVASLVSLIILFSKKANAE